jgi:hypothetical protein
VRKRAIGGSHGCIKVSTMSEILTDKILRALESLVSEVYADCLCIGCICIEGICRLTVYKEHIVDKIMEICV